MGEGAHISAGRGAEAAGDAVSPKSPRLANLGELTPSEERIAQRVAELLRPREDAILNRAEAMAYVKRRSEGAFSKWCRTYRVKPYHRGRYSRQQLDVALSFEARKRGVL
jgi:hypothetical protein